MNVRLTQIIDYWCGIPLCALFSAWNALVRGFVTKRSPQPSKVLFIELSEMGSALLAYSAIEEAVKCVGNRTDVYFLIFESNVESVELLGVIPDKNVLRIDDSSLLRFIFSTIMTLFRIRRLRIDTAIDLELFSRFTALVSYLSGAKSRVGFSNYTEEGLYRGNLLTHSVWYQPFAHISQNFLHLVQALQEETLDLPLIKKEMAARPGVTAPPFVADQDELAVLSARLRDVVGQDVKNSSLVILNPDPGQLPLRGWPLTHYAELVKRVKEKCPQALFLVCGTKSSDSYFKKLEELCRTDKLFNFCGMTNNLRELLILLQMADCFITSDSGPAHLVTLTDTPAMILFGPESPERYAPLGDNISIFYAGLACSPCYSAANHRRSCCTNNVCMQQISVEEVAQRVGEQL